MDTAAGKRRCLNWLHRWLCHRNLQVRVGVRWKAARITVYRKGTMAFLDKCQNRWTFGWLTFKLVTHGRTTTNKLVTLEFCRVTFLALTMPIVRPLLKGSYHGNC